MFNSRICSTPECASQTTLGKFYIHLFNKNLNKFNQSLKMERIPTLGWTNIACVKL